jgi:hypothetical protein
MWMCAQTRRREKLARRPSPGDVMTLDNFWFAVGFVSICAMSIIVYA